MKNIIFLFLCFCSHFTIAANLSCSGLGHFDLYIDIYNNQLRVNAEKNFPRSWRNYVIVPADLGDPAGGPHKTDDPGWVVRSGDFLPDQLLSFKALDKLYFWDFVQKKWLSKVPNGEYIRFFGTIPPKVYARNDPNELAFYRGGTIFKVDGISGPLTSPIEPAGYTGSIHSHLDFCVQDAQGDCVNPKTSGPPYPTGNPSKGAYLIKMELFSDKGEKPSKPILIVLNNGLNDEECGMAVEALQQVPKSDVPTQLPATGILLL